jgi:hypothetical protein
MCCGVRTVALSLLRFTLARFPLLLFLGSE